MRAPEDIRAEIFQAQEAHNERIEALEDELELALHRQWDLEWDLEEKLELERTRQAEVEQLLADPNTAIQQYGFEEYVITGDNGTVCLGEDPDRIEEDIEAIWETFIEDDRVDGSDEHHYYVISRAAREYLEACHG